MHSPMTLQNILNAKVNGLELYLNGLTRIKIVEIDTNENKVEYIELVNIKKINTIDLDRFLSSVRRKQLFKAIK